MNIKCLFGDHIWKFGYHHGMPLGMSTEDALKMVEDGKTYSVDVCARHNCGKQSRIINRARVILKRDEMEIP